MQNSEVMEMHGEMRVPSQKWQEFDSLQENILAGLGQRPLTSERKKAQFGHGFFEGLK